MKYFSLQLQPVNSDISSRTRPPTILVDGKSNMQRRTAAKRRLHLVLINQLHMPFDTMILK